MKVAGIPWKLSTTIITVLSVAGVGAFAYSLLQLTAIQAQMDETMSAINTSVATTGGLVGQTSKALQPLTKTTEALVSIEQRQESTVSHLASMNNHLRNIGDTETNIIRELDALNQTSSQITGQLANMQTVNAKLLSQSRESVTQAGEMTNKVADLNNMTSTSIAELHKLNGKLGALRLLP